MKAKQISLTKRYCMIGNILRYRNRRENVILDNSSFILCTHNLTSQVCESLFIYCPVIYPYLEFKQILYRTAPCP